LDKATTQSEQLAKLREMIEDIDICMFTTAEPDGTLRSRPMSTQQSESDGDLWYYTLEDTPKVDELESDQRVNLSFASPKKNRYVSVSGTARIVRDRQKIKELWQPILEVWFPKGQDDPNLALIKVSVEQAEYWDDTSNKMVQLMKMVKAAVMGASYEGENEKLSL